MQTLKDVDLRNDSAAASYLKQEEVQVAFAQTAGALMSLEGPNQYQIGDALITGSTGDRWSVSRERFDARYQAAAPTVDGQDGVYRNRPIPVLARRMEEDFSVHRSVGGDLLHGRAGDWLLQYAPGDYGVVEQGRFAQVYRPLADSPAGR